MEDLPPVRFNAKVELPHEDDPVEIPPPPSPVAKLKKRATLPKFDPVNEEAPCCPAVSGSDPLMEILPTILAGLGAAWLIGVATGAFIFSTPSE